MKIKFALFLISAAAFGQDASYFPLDIGNQWIYRVTGGRLPAAPWTVEVTGTRTIGGNEYAVVTGFRQPGELLLRWSGASLVFYDSTSLRERPWADFSAPAGGGFLSDIDECVRSARVAEKDVKYQSALGQHSNAVKFTYEVTCADAGITEEVFVPGIGLMRRVYSTIAGPQVFELVHARIGGSASFSEPGYSFHLTLNRAVYESGDEILARITLRNTAEPPLELVFPSGQDFDISIRNERGETVYQWSATRSFIQVIRELSFRGERNWIEPLRLSLTPGSYTATATLAVQGPRFESTFPFRVIE